MELRLDVPEQPPDSASPGGGDLKPEHIADVLNHLHTGVWIANADCVGVYANPAMAHLLGVPHSELTGRTLTSVMPRLPEFFAPEPPALDLQATTNADAVVRDVTDVHVRRPDGDMVWWHVRRVRRQGADGSTVATILLIRDTTAVVFEREAREFAERKFQQFTLDAPTGLAVLAPDGVILELNPALSQITGREAAELLGRSIWDLTHPADLDVSRSAFAEVVSGNLDSAAVEMRFLDSAGDPAWASFHVGSMRAPDGTAVALIAQVIDISVQKSVEQELARSEQAYRLIADNAGDIVMRVEAGRWVWLSPSLQTVLGLAESDVLGERSTELVHPDDVETFTRAVDAVDAEDRALTRVRLRSAAHGWLWTECLCSPVHDDNGQTQGALVIARDISAQVRAEQSAAAAQADLAYSASYDLLTGLRNRHAVLTALSDSLAECEPDRFVAVLVIDVDNFKIINDGISHAAGDQLLMGVSRRIALKVRPSDVVGRLGGDEFAAVLTGLRKPTESTIVAQRIRDAVAESSISALDRQLTTSVSIGIGVSGRGGDASELLSEADSALYMAKAGGKNRWELSDGAMRAAAARRLDMGARIREGLAAGQFHAWFQPVVDLTASTVAGYEALARWVTPQGVIPAAEFIGTADELGLTRELGWAVISAAIHTLPNLPEGRTMSVNMSPSELSQAGIGDRIIALLREADADPARLIIEVTEQELMHLSSAGVRDVNRLRELGVGLHVDDFGTGFASFATLRDYPVTGVKLDRTFTQRLSGPGGEWTQRLVAGISDLAQRLGLLRIAEGVEDQAQVVALRDLGWGLGQGYLFGRAEPWPPSEDIQQIP